MSPDSEWWAKVFGSIPEQVNQGNYLVFPSHRDPRVIVDRNCDVAVSEALARAFKNRRLPGNVADPLARISRPLFTRRQPSWKIDDASPNSLRSMLVDVLGPDIELSVAVGPPRPNRKPVIRCYQKGALIAVAKLGPDPHTAEMVRNEAAWLNRLAGITLDGFIVPELLHLGALGSGPLLVMSALPLDGDPSTAFLTMPHHLLDEAFDQFASYSFADSPWRHKLVTRVARLGDRNLAETTESLIGQADLAELPTAAWHGDWSPWNVGRTASRQWCIWDWERADEGAPRGFDLCHLYTTYASEVPDPGLSLHNALATAGISPGHVELTRSLYALEREVRLQESLEAVGTAP